MKQVVIALGYVVYNDKRRIVSQENALRVLGMRPKEHVSVVSFEFVGSLEHIILSECDIHHLPILKKDSSLIEYNHRRMPYIKEILNYCSKISCDTFGYINSDILVSNDVYDILQSGYDAYIFSRYDVGEVTPDNFLDGKAKVIYGGDTHAGADGFFFKKSWWEKNKDKFPDGLIVGETEWDTCYRKIIKESDANYFEGRVLYHVYHDSKWNVNSPGGKANTKIYKELCEG